MVDDESRRHHSECISCPRYEEITSRVFYYRSELILYSLLVKCRSKARQRFSSPNHGKSTRESISEITGAFHLYFYY